MRPACRSVVTIKVGLAHTVPRVTLDVITHSYTYAHAEVRVTNKVKLCMVVVL